MGATSAEPTRHPRGGACPRGAPARTRARAALEQADEILKVMPDQPQALALPGLALGRLGRRRCGDRGAAARGAPQARVARRVARARAITTARSTCAKPRTKPSRQHIRHSTRDPKLMIAALALSENRIPDAERLLREHLRHYPDGRRRHPHAGRSRGAHRPHRGCGDAAGALPRARAGFHGRAAELRDGAAPAEQTRSRASRSADRCSPTSPTNPGLRNLKAAILGRIGEFDEVDRAIPRRARRLSASSPACG